MTYKEAAAYISDNWDKMQERIKQTAPPSELWGTFIAPENVMGDKKLAQLFFNEVLLKNVGNETTILDISSYAFVSNNLRPFVVLRMAGKPITLELQGYLQSGFSGV